MCVYHTIEFEEADASRARPQPLLPQHAADVTGCPCPTVPPGTPTAPPGLPLCWEKRLRTHPGRVCFFKSYRVGRVRGAAAAVSPSARTNAPTSNARR
eukprot:gene23406-biopygen4326